VRVRYHKTGKSRPFLQPKVVYGRKLYDQKDKILIFSRSTSVHGHLFDQERMRSGSGRNVTLTEPCGWVAGVSRWRISIHSTAKAGCSRPHETHDFAVGSDLLLNNAMVSRRIVPLAEAAVFSALEIKDQAKCLPRADIKWLFVPAGAQSTIEQEPGMPADTRPSRQRSRSQCRGRTAACQIPRNTGRRFSMKARRPSMKSSLAKQSFTRRSQSPQSAS
jgi:hypothetical protein